MIRKLFIISFVWAIFILIMSGLPGDSLPTTRFMLIPFFDKLVHIGLYVPLAFFLLAEFSLSRRKFSRITAVSLTLLIVAFYGGLIELAQDYLFVDRFSDWKDFLSDIIGGIIGISLFFLFGKRIFRSL